MSFNRSGEKRERKKTHNKQTKYENEKKAAALSRASERGGVELSKCDFTLFDFDGTLDFMYVYIQQVHAQAHTV